MSAFLQVIDAMGGFFHSIQQRPTTATLLGLSLVAFSGLALGSIRIRGIGLGIAGILFTGILFGHFGMTASHEVLEFARDAGLVLFVYTIGIQVGPGFIDSLRRQGLTLNLLAASIVVLGAGVTLIASKFGGVDAAVASGLFAGATTNTPSLGAAQEALKSLPGVPPGHLALPALGYAVSYPFGILGIIISMLAIRWVFRVRAEEESRVIATGADAPPLIERRNVEISNAAFHGLPIARLNIDTAASVKISRVKPKDVAEVSSVSRTSIVQCGDVVLAVGTGPQLDAFCQRVGRVADVDLMKTPGKVRFRRVIVTRKEVLGKSLGEMAIEEHHGVTVTRLTRADVELVASPSQHLHFGDVLQIVGEEGSLDRAAAELGNSVKALNAINLLPILLGIALGLFLGSIPIHVPGMPAPISLGIAGGPLIVAIVLSRLGCVGPLHWYMPATINTALRELGIAVFLASVGLMAGSKFLDVLFNGDGGRWVLFGAAITLIPLLLVGSVARIFLKLNFSKICGLLAGSMTDPPALAFATTVAKNDAPSVAYATIYPLTMTLRILTVQAIVLLLAK